MNNDLRMIYAVVTLIFGIVLILHFISSQAVVAIKFTGFETGEINNTNFTWTYLRDGTDVAIPQAFVSTTNPLNGTYSLEINHTGFNYGGLINRTNFELTNHTLSIWVNSNKTGYTGYLNMWSGTNKDGTYTAFTLQQLTDCTNGRICTYIGSWEESAVDYPANTWVNQIVHVNSSGVFFFLNNQSTLIRKSAAPTSLGTFTLQSNYGYHDDVAICEGQTFNCVESVAVDTCTCAGAGEDWEIDMSDYCNITDACDLTTGTLSFTGAGWCNCNASVDTTNLGDPGASGILYIQDSCLITID